MTRERVLETAMILADQDGIGALSMRTLGAALGVQAMSLYNHVANKEEILDGIVDLAVSEIEIPSEADPWQIAMTRRAVSAHAVLLRHPWACGLIMSRVNIGPAMLRYIDATIGCLRGAGFTLPMVDHVWNAMDSHIYGFSLHKLNFPLKVEEYASVAASFLPMLPATKYPHMRALTEHVAAGLHDGVHDIEFALRLLLDELERLRVVELRATE